MNPFNNLASVAPAWWPTLPDQIAPILSALPGITTTTIGHSAGGRPIPAFTLGDRDDLPGRTSISLASARGAKKPSAFYGEGKRTRQHILFVGATHGTEFEGTAAMTNVLHAIITGKDLRGRAWPALHEMAGRFRIVFVPLLNIDGRMRYAEVVNVVGMDVPTYARMTFGVFKDGSTQTWPECKKFMPQPVDQLQIIGSYFNDAGVNLVYDDFFGEPQPETRALMKLCRDELPDIAIFAHANHGSLVEPASYIPRNYQFKLAQLSGAVARRCSRDGINKRLVADPDPYCGQQFYQTDAVHHHCGALPVLFELPYGNPTPPGSLDHTLNVSMTAIEEMFAFGADYGFRPPKD